MTTPGPILVTELFPKLNQALLELLRSLTAEEWMRPTSCSQWDVKDVAAHLLDTTLRRLAIHRDGYISPETPKLTTERDLASFVNQSNAEWVRAARRLSPRLLIEMLEAALLEMYEFFRALDPDQPAVFPVSWAGEQKSANWFDIAREYTEKWHHQEQIREAVGRPGLASREYLFPVLDTFLRALPHAYRDVLAPEGTLLRVAVGGPAGGDWFLQRRQNRWELLFEVTGKLAATVHLPQHVAWKLFTKGTEKASAEQEMRFEGDRELGRHVLEMICIVG